MCAAEQATLARDSKEPAALPKIIITTRLARSPRIRIDEVLLYKTKWARPHHLPPFSDVCVVFTPRGYCVELEVLLHLIYARPQSATEQDSVGTGLVFLVSCCLVRFLGCGEIVCVADPLCRFSCIFQLFFSLFCFCCCCSSTRPSVLRFLRFQLLLVVPLLTLVATYTNAAAHARTHTELRDYDEFVRRRKEKKPPSIKLQPQFRMASVVFNGRRFSA